MPDSLTEQLEHWGRDRATSLASEAPAVPEEFVRGVRRVRRERRIRFAAAGAMCIVLIGAGAALLLPSAPTAAPRGSVPIALHPTQAASGGFTVAQIQRANHHFESDDLQLPEVSLAWTRELPQLW